MDLVQGQIADVSVQLFQMEGVGSDSSEVSILLQEARGCLSENARRPYAEY